MRVFITFLVLALPLLSRAQEKKIRAIIQSDAQWYLRDEILDPSGEFYPDEKLLGQGFALFTYTDGDFEAGMRYENYQNVMLGFPNGFRGEGITIDMLESKEKTGILLLEIFMSSLGQV